MKILIAGINYAPDLVGIAKYTTEMCQFLRDQGHDVVVVTEPPYYPAWRIVRPYKGYVYPGEVAVRSPAHLAPFDVCPDLSTGAADRGLSFSAGCRAVDSAVAADDAGGRARGAADRCEDVASHSGLRG
ncbi:hypothetical protein E4T56_gene14688 [Termitomyces sp. T112]|nr:hypothetical protein E4T56_gene14688 [Termitomyces sp. T112]